MAFIYKITNDINDKMYIGKTEYSNPEKRWKMHLNDYKKRRCEKRPLYSAMNKYGEEHFHFEVIEETDSPEERERYWIDKFRTYVGFDDCNGYNATLGGDGKSYLDLDEDEVIKYHTEEACYITKNTANHFNVDPSTIREILKKKNIVLLTNKSSRLMKSYIDYGGVFQININSKIIINIFENTINAANYIGCKSSQTISNACRGQDSRHSHYACGYLWYYGKDVQEAIENNEILDVIYY